MAEVAFVKKLEQVFECSICLQMAVEPKLLPCHHTFCTKCIQNTYDHAIADDRTTLGRITCPLCKSMSRLSSGDLTCLPSDFRANNVTSLLHERSRKVDEENKRVDCYVCQKRGHEREASALCFDCAKPYCEECYLKHNAREIFADHAHSAMVSGDKKSLICAEHGEIFQNLCRTCDCTVCSVCMLTDHDDHHIVGFTRLQPDDTKLLNNANETETHLEYLIRRIPILQSKSAVHKAQTIAKITRSKQSLIDAIEQYAKQLLLTLDSETNRIDDDLCDIMDNAKTYLAELQDLKPRLECIIKPLVHAPDVKLVDTSGIVEQAKEVCSTRYDLPSPKLYSFEGFDGVIFGSLLETRPLGAPYKVSLPSTPGRTYCNTSTNTWNRQRWDGADVYEDDEEYGDGWSGDVRSTDSPSEDEYDSREEYSYNSSDAYPDCSEDDYYC